MEMTQSTNDGLWPKAAGQNFQNLRFERPVSGKATVQLEWQVRVRSYLSTPYQFLAREHTPTILPGLEIDLRIKFG